MYALLFLVFGVMCATTDSRPVNSSLAKTSDDYEAVSADAMRKHLNHLSGVYANEENLQSEIAQMSAEQARNPMFRPQNIILYPFWKKQSAPDEWWYYLGWYAADDKETALDEAIFHFTIQNNLAHVDVYCVPTHRAAEWKSRNPFGDMDVKALTACLSTSLYSQELPGGGLRLFSPMGQPFKRTGTSPAAYMYVNFDMRFYPDQITSKSSFLDAVHKPIAIRSLDFAFNKSTVEPHEF